MLWRPERGATYADEVRLPGVDASGAVVGCFDPQHLREALVWRRLISGTFPNVPVLLLMIKTRWTRKEQEAVRAAFPPSEQASLQFLSDSEGRWSEIQDVAKTTFVAWTQNGAARRILLGGPTDEGWDRFEEAAP